jgi:hypothetical protein
MILLVASAIAASARLDTEATLQLCRPILARKVEGDIQTISVTSIHHGRDGVRLEGDLTAFIGMAAPEPGSASAHHLIRSDFHFRCRTAHRRVREASVTPVR